MDANSKEAVKVKQAEITTMTNVSPFNEEVYDFAFSTIVI